MPSSGASRVARPHSNRSRVSDARPVDAVCCRHLLPTVSCWVIGSSTAQEEGTGTGTATDPKPPAAATAEAVTARDEEAKEASGFGALRQRIRSVDAAGSAELHAAKESLVRRPARTTALRLLCWVWEGDVWPGQG